LLQRLTDIFNEIKAHDDLKVVVLRAIGDSFSTGGDLREFWKNRDDLATFANALLGDLNDAVASIIECDLPVVGVVNGQVTGGALGLVLACDFTVVTERASFTPYYVDVGFGPDGGWTAILPHIIGHGRASAVQLMNVTITAEQAVEWGIAYQMSPVDRLDQLLDDICARIIAKKSGSVRLTKSMLRGVGYRERLDDERRAFVKKIVSQEALLGIEEFVGER
jgi:2-(1,2-epoxy-1,2-dihydrophenyl)acetyl-CoA isomerase